MKITPILLALSLILAACSPANQAASTPTNPVSPEETVVEQPNPTSTAPAAPPAEALNTATPEIPEEAEPPSVEELVRDDEQGQIFVTVTPLNLTNPGEALEFQVDLNTHSVDLSMDLAPMATLTTDTGAAVQASLWNAPLGGHHVSGTLVFPGAVDGKPLLEGAEELTLTIIGLDVPERVFWWELTW